MSKSYIFVPEFTEESLEGKKLRPEVMAALFARFSRTGDGMEKILADVKELDFNDEDAMVNRILKFIDYGHASIGGLTGGIGVGTDQISMLEPYLAFFLQSKQDGQETSTRYCEFKPEGLAHPSDFNVPQRFHEDWYQVMLEGFEISNLVNKKLDMIVSENPSLAGVPEGAPEKVANRMKKNYGFDRARYTLPLPALTNFGLIMTAREWADTLKFMVASPIKRTREWSQDITDQMKESVPNLMKHAGSRRMTEAYMKNFFERGVEYIKKNGVNTEYLPDEVFTNVQLPAKNGMIDEYKEIEERISKAFEGKENRYDIPKGYPQKVNVSVYWNNMAFAEARDINRQRPCAKDTLFAPHGFYMAPEMEEAIKDLGLTERYKRLQDKRAKLITNLANSENPESYVSAMFLGDQSPFELHTDAAHMSYVLELRTGMGVHFRYDQHMRQAFNKFEKQLPEWTKHVILGTGEPE
ncbi:hypothetical protein K9L67_03450 [Candidatus Woesearchaeota archaeon]|nr:hypothetical protein [Candidatus Woesearchaeota archaeon]MCF7901258.1 hypothetical protein [Candidatus Woesearchaeota archaeon]MCF8013575.1 hypothetical protein [Candidatus Woesearchaeota archaeon]